MSDHQGTPKAQRGRKRKKSGTPGSGRPSLLSTPVKVMPLERKQKYDRQRKAKARGQMSTPCKRVVSTYTRLSRGRPPLFGVAMSPKALKERKCVLKHKRKISQIRTVPKNPINSHFMEIPDLLEDPDEVKDDCK